MRLFFIFVFPYMFTIPFCFRFVLFCSFQIPSPYNCSFFFLRLWWFIERVRTCSLGLPASLPLLLPKSLHELTVCCSLRSSYPSFSNVLFSRAMFIFQFVKVLGKRRPHNFSPFRTKLKYFVNYPICGTESSEDTPRLRN